MTDEREALERAGYTRTMDITQALMGPHEWGYRCPVEGGFIEDRTPFAAAELIAHLRAQVAAREGLYDALWELVAAHAQADSPIKRERVAAADKAARRVLLPSKDEGAPTTVALSVAGGVMVTAGVEPPAPADLTGIADLDPLPDVWTPNLEALESAMTRPPQWIKGNGPVNCAQVIAWNAGQTHTRRAGWCERCGRGLCPFWTTDRYRK